MINFESKLPFRFHVGALGESQASVLNHAFPLRAEADGLRPWKLYTPSDRLLPFQIFIPIDIFTTQDLYIEECFIVPCDTSIPLEDGGPLGDTDFTVYQKPGEGIWFVYDGNSPLYFAPLPAGFYQVQMTLQSGRYVVSEWFYVTCAEDPLATKLLVEYGNSCDLMNIIYQGGYKNRFYIDGTLSENKPNVEQSGFEDGFGRTIMTGIRYVDNYELQDYVPEYMMNAMLLMQAHNDIVVTLPNNLGSAPMRVDKVASAPGESGQDYTVTITFEQLALFYTSACCNNKTFATLIPLHTVAGTIKLNSAESTFTLLPSVLQNDQGYQLTATVGTFATTAGGSVHIYSNGFYDYTPPSSHYVGTDSFTYTAHDSFGSTATGTQNVVSGPTKANNDEFFVGAYTVGTLIFPLSQSVLLNDYLPYNYAYSPIIVGTGTNYTQTNVSGNTMTINRTTGQVTFTKVTTLGDGSGHDFENFTYQIQVATGVFSTATVRFDYDL